MIADNKWRRPSTVADQAVAQGQQHPPTLADTRSGVFSRTTDCVIPSSVPVQFVALLPQQISTLQTNISSVDEGVESDLSMSERESIADSSFSSTASGTGCMCLNRGSAVSDIMSMCHQLAGDVNDSTGGGGGGSVSSSLSMASSYVSDSAASINSAAGGPSYDVTMLTAVASADSVDVSATRSRSLRAPAAANYCHTTPSSPRHFPAIRPLKTNAAAMYHRPPPMLAGLGVSEDSDEQRRNSRSPISFREGRRASDGLMSQGLVAFHQRLVETKGLPELQRELDSLQTYYKPTLTSAELLSLQQQHRIYLGQSSEGDNLPVTSGQTLPTSSVPPMLAALGTSDTRQLNAAPYQRQLLQQQQQQHQQQMLVQQQLQNRRAAFQRRVGQVVAPVGTASGTNALLLLHQKFQKMDIISSPVATSIQAPTFPTQSAAAQRPGGILLASEQTAVSPMARRHHVLLHQHNVSSLGESDSIGGISLVLQQQQQHQPASVVGLQEATLLSPMFEDAGEDETGQQP